jgi:hypothetical protein
MKLYKHASLFKQDKNYVGTMFYSIGQLLSSLPVAIMLPDAVCRLSP